METHPEEMAAQQLAGPRMVEAPPQEDPSGAGRSSKAEDIGECLTSAEGASAVRRWQGNEGCGCSTPEMGGATMVGRNRDILQEKVQRGYVDSESEHVQLFNATVIVGLRNDEQNSRCWTNSQIILTLWNFARNTTREHLNMKVNDASCGVMKGRNRIL